MREHIVTILPELQMQADRISRAATDAIISCFVQPGVLDLIH